MNKLIAVVIAAATLSASATQYSCLSVITECKRIGKWDAVKAWIVAANLKDEWDKCHYLSDTYPQYAQITNSIVSSGVLTTDELAVVISNSVDSAVADAMLCRVVSNDCTTANGRIKWHGNLVTNKTDDASLTKTEVYEDGYVYVKKYSKLKAKSMYEHLSEAELKAKRDAAAQRLRDLAAKNRAERIANLQTNMTALATALAKKKQYPLDLATMLLQHELNTLIGTNTVDAVVFPQN